MLVDLAHPRHGRARRGRTRRVERGRVRGTRAHLGQLRGGGPFLEPRVLKPRVVVARIPLHARLVLEPALGGDDGVDSLAVAPGALEGRVGLEDGVDVLLQGLVEGVAVDRAGSLRFTRQGFECRKGQVEPRRVGGGRGGRCALAPSSLGSGCRLGVVLVDDNHAVARLLLFLSASFCGSGCVFICAEYLDGALVDSPRLGDPPGPDLFFILFSRGKCEVERERERVSFSLLSFSVTTSTRKENEKRKKHSPHLPLGPRDVRVHSRKGPHVALVDCSRQRRVTRGRDAGRGAL